MKFYTSLTVKPNTTSEFINSNEKKQYQKSLDEEPENWIYRDKKIRYTNNENGFRTKSIKDIDWENSIIMLGCSMVYGLGLAEKDTLPHRLQNILNIPVINLGVPGAGIDLCCWNSLILRENNITPKAIIQVWPHVDRYSELDSEVENQTAPRIGYMKEYHADHAWNKRSKLYVKTDRLLWKNKTHYIETSFMPDSVSELSVLGQWIKDFARDNTHPGIQSMKLASEQLSKELIERGILNNVSQKIK